MADQLRGLHFVTVTALNLLLISNLLLSVHKYKVSDLRENINKT
jgi:hypothetical protein